MGSMNGTAPNRFLLRALRVSTIAGESSTSAGPMLVPIVPMMKSTEVKARTARRTDAPYEVLVLDCYGWRRIFPLSHDGARDKGATDEGLDAVISIVDHSHL